MDYTEEEKFLKSIGVEFNDKITLDDIGAFLTLVASFSWMLFLIWLLGVL